MTNTNLENLSLLGSSTNVFNGLEAFPNLNQERDYTVTLETNEFTCVCPKTGQPDFANMTIKYMPNKSIVESKSLKLYFQTYRNKGIFHEHVTNLILNDIVKTIQPKWCQVIAQFGLRGGISITVDAEYKMPKSEKNTV